MPESEGHADHQHPSEHDWERLACGELEAGERERILGHTRGCADCAAVGRALRSLTEAARAFDPAVTELQPAPRIGGFGARRSLLLGLAASVLFLLFRPAADPSTPPLPEAATYRGGAAVLAPAPLTPRGSVASLPAELSWTPISEPALYRVIVLNADGDPVWSSGEVDAATLPWPADLQLRPGRYSWQVEALPRSAWHGERLSSSLLGFEIVTSSPR
jgi:hypothetical protein